MGYKQYSTRAQMESDGWKFSHQPELATCRQCGAAIEWAKSPKGKSIPLNPKSTVIHFDSCGNASAPEQQEASQAPPPQPQQQPTSSAAMKKSIDELTVAIRA